MQNCDKSPVDVSSRGDSGEPAWTENSRRDSPRHGICTPHLLHSSNIAHRHFGSGSTCLSQEPKLGSLDPNPRFFNIKARDTTLETREKQLARATERDVQFGPVWRVGMEGRHGVNLKIWRVENLNARIFHFPSSILSSRSQLPSATPSPKTNACVPFNTVQHGRSRLLFLRNISSALSPPFF